jgi:hypothetical protein
MMKRPLLVLQARKAALNWVALLAQPVVPAILACKVQ